MAHPWLVLLVVRASAHPPKGLTFDSLSRARTWVWFPPRPPLVLMQLEDLGPTLGSTVHIPPRGRGAHATEKEVKTTLKPLKHANPVPPRREAS